MNRHLYIITNSGSPTERIPNVKADRDNYLAFFQSPEGGAWLDGEISIREDNFSLEEITQDIYFFQTLKKPLDYLLIVFCGHGGYNVRTNQRCFELRPDGSASADVSLEQIKSVCDGVRTLLITDSCLGSWSPQQATRQMFSAINESTQPTTMYVERCRNMYNEKVMETDEDTFVATFAVSIAENAQENNRGGVYSQNLLEVARETVDSLKRKDTIYDYLPISFIHEIASERVIKATNGKQHPDILMPRSKKQLPFVVCPK